MLEKLKENKKMWIVIAVGIIVIIGVLFAALAKKDTKNSDESGKQDTNIETSQEQNDTDISDDMNSGDGIEIVDEDTADKEDSVNAPASWGGEEDSKDNTSNGANSDSSDNNTTSNDNKDGTEEDNDQDEENVSKENVLKDEKEWSAPF